MSYELQVTSIRWVTQWQYDWKILKKSWKLSGHKEKPWLSFNTTRTRRYEGHAFAGSSMMFYPANKMVTMTETLLNIDSSPQENNQEVGLSFILTISDAYSRWKQTNGKEGWEIMYPVGVFLSTRLYSSYAGVEEDRRGRARSGVEEESLWWLCSAPTKKISHSAKYMLHLHPRIKRSSSASAAAITNHVLITLKQEIKLDL